MLYQEKAHIITTGLDISEHVFYFFLLNETFSQSIELKLQDLVNKLKTSLIETSRTTFFLELAKKISIVLYISGSMDGIPIQTVLLYMLLITKVFEIKTLYYFETYLH